MKRDKLKKIISVLSVGVMFSSLGMRNIVFAKDSSEEKIRVSVHDPSIVKDGDEYYVFGSHIEAAKSTDLENWEVFTNGYTTPNNILFGDLSDNLQGSFSWAGENDADSKGGYSVWAPTVFWNNNYVNDDGSLGAYMMYYCTSSTYKRSAIGYAVSKNIEGPYDYVDTIMYSGFTEKDSYDANSDKNTNYVNTHIDELIEEGIIDDINSSWFLSSGEYNTSYAPNAIDPELFYDKNGKLWMTYGSWSGGIYILEIDDSTGRPIYPGMDSKEDETNFTDRYFGKRISGGFTQSGEGADVVYDSETGYYYLTVTYGYLTSDGGYNMRMFRSENPDGPYLDAKGNNAALGGNIDNSNYGIKLISNYKFDCNDKVYKAAGHNSVLLDDNGERYLVYHQRFDDGTEYHEVRVHQMFINEEGWPVVAPYENSGDKILENGYEISEIIGSYEFINQGSSNSSAIEKTLNIELNEDYTVSGDVLGTWSITEESYYMNIEIDGVTYKGVFFKEQDESENRNQVMTFTALGDNNQCIWGSKLELDDYEATKYAGRYLENSILEKTKENFNLPKEGKSGTKISWSSSDESVMTSEGLITRADEDKKVILTATITKGEVLTTKEFEITVIGLLREVGETPIYKYDFEEVSANEVLNSGSKEGNSLLIGSATVLEDEKRDNVLQITSNKDDKKTNYLELPEDTFQDITKEGYTVSMWVNIDTTDPNYFEHSALFEASDNSNYPMTRISANLYGRINANGDYADATEISKSLEGNKWEYVTYTVSGDGIVVYVNGDKVSEANKDISQCFSENFLANMTDVRIGSGNIWSDMDIAKAKFDNVEIYSKALNSKQVEALYNKEINNGGSNIDEEIKDEDAKQETDTETKDENINNENKNESNIGDNKDNSQNKDEIKNETTASDKKQESSTITGKLPSTGVRNVVSILGISGIFSVIGGITLKKKK